MSAPPILLVEDNDDDVALTRRMLETSDIRNPLHLASSIDEAKRYLRAVVEGAQSPALLILDLQLPDGGGMNLLEWVRSQPSPVKYLPALVVTGSQDRTDEMAAERLSTLLYLRKPVDIELLSAAIVHLGLRLADEQQGALIAPHTPGLDPPAHV